MTRSSAGGDPVGSRGAAPAPPCQRSLCVLVTSAATCDPLLEIARSAGIKAINCWIHLTGAGVLLSRAACFPELCALAHVSVCLESARACGVAAELRRLNPPVLVPGHRLADLLMACDRHLTL